jgi:hypothetical protein
MLCILCFGEIKCSYAWKAVCADKNKHINYNWTFFTMIERLHLMREVEIKYSPGQNLDLSGHIQLNGQKMQM